MQKEEAAIVDKTSSERNRRLTARYAIHAELESNLYLLKAFEGEAVKTANYLIADDKRSRSITTSNSEIPNPHENTSSISCSKLMEKCGGFNETIKASGAVEQQAIACLRLFTDKNVLTKLTSKGMPTWEVLYSQSNAETSSDHLSSFDQTIAHRIRAFLGIVKDALGGVIPPQLAVTSVRLLQKYNDDKGASLLIRESITNLLQYHRTGSAEPDLTIWKDLPDSILISKVREQFHRMVQRGLFGSPVSIGSTDILPPSNKAAASLISLLALDVECCAKLSRNFSPLFCVTQNSSVDSDQLSVLLKEWVPRLPQQSLSQLVVAAETYQKERNEAEKRTKEQADEMGKWQKLEALQDHQTQSYQGTSDPLPSTVSSTSTSISKSGKVKHLLQYGVDTLVRRDSSWKAKATVVSIIIALGVILVTLLKRYRLISSLGKVLTFRRSPSESRTLTL